MDLTFQDPGLGYSVDSIMDFQTGDQSDFWKAPLFYFYPQLDRTRFEALPPKEQVGYLKNTLQEVYDSALIAQKVESYQVHWESNRKVVEEAMSDAFGLDPGALYNDLVVNVTLNSISPRYLQERRFDVFYLNSPKGALGVSLHEMVHFLWFYVWNRHFGDSFAEYETPHLKWVLSEMAVESIMRDERLRARNPYFESGCVYDYFYQMRIDGAPILDTLNKMYHAAPIQSFMEQSYAYCLTHKKEIRAQMR